MVDKSGINERNPKFINRSSYWWCVLGFILAKLPCTRKRFNYPIISNASTKNLDHGYGYSILCCQDLFVVSFIVWGSLCFHEEIMERVFLRKKLRNMFGVWCSWEIFIFICFPFFLKKKKEKKIYHDNAFLHAAAVCTTC